MLEQHFSVPLELAFYFHGGTDLFLLSWIELSAMLDIPFVPDWNGSYLHAGTGPFYAKF
jgi:hypothetical protein